MVDKYVLAEFVPLGSVAQIKAVLSALDGAEENVMVNTAKEEYMAVAHSAAGATYHGLDALCTLSVGCIVYPSQ